MLISVHHRLSSHQPPTLASALSFRQSALNALQAAWTPYEAALARRTKFTVAGTLASVEKRQHGTDDRSAWLFRFRCGCLSGNVTVSRASRIAWSAL